MRHCAVVAVLLLVGRVFAAPAPTAASAEPVRLKYNRLGATSFLKTGLWSNPVVVDFDGDGDLDIVSVCSDTPSHGAYFFENPTPRGKKDAFPLFKAPVKIRDERFTQLLVGQQVGKNFVVTDRQCQNWNFFAAGERGFRPFRFETGEGFSNRNVCIRLFDVDGDGHEDLFCGMDDWSGYDMFNPVSGYSDVGTWTRDILRTRLFWARHVSGEGVEAVYATPQEIVEPEGDTFSRMGRPYPMPADWDGDGTTDLILGDFRENFHYFCGLGFDDGPRFGKGRMLIAEDGKPLAVEQCMMTPTAVDWDGDGDLDIICGEEDGRVGFIENTGKLKDGMPIFRQPRHFRQEAELLGCNVLVTPAAADMDGDGDLDLVCGTSGGWIEYIENLSGPGVEFPSWAEPVRLNANGKTIRILAGSNGSLQGPAESKFGYTNVSLADWDGDGLVDILMNSILGEVMWYRNCGTRALPAFAAARPIEVEWSSKGQPVQPWRWKRPAGKGLVTQWRTTPAAFDLNDDVLCDLAMLDQKGYLAFFERFRDAAGVLRLKMPRRIFVDAKGKPIRLNKKVNGKSGRRKIAFADYDGDGKFDLLIGRKHAVVRRQVGRKNGCWVFGPECPLADYTIAGHIAAPCPVDFNGDGKVDLVVGGEDGFFYYLAHREVTNKERKTWE